MVTAPDKNIKQKKIEIKKKKNTTKKKLKKQSAK